jgi:NADH-quinone oxidoreductase subunit E
MLSEEERHEIEEEIKIFPYKQAACIEALKVIQKHRRWVSDEGIKDIAGILEMTPDEIDGVASFYNLLFRRPVGRYVILVCDSVSCWVMGYEEIKRSLEEKLEVRFGETTKDDRFTLLPVPCLGTCDRAPAIMIGDDLHQDLTAEKLDKILEQYK